MPTAENRLEIFTKIKAEIEERDEMYEDEIPRPENEETGEDS